MTAARVDTELEVVRGELARADGKASTLLSLVGAALAVTTGSLATARARFPLVVLAAGWAGMAFLATAVLVLLRIVRPVLLGGPALRHPNPDRELAGLSALAVRKYWRIARACDLTAAGLFLLAVAAVSTAVLL